MSGWVRFRRLLPEPGIVTAAEAARAVDPTRAAGERPWVMINMVATADGRATLAGRAGPIGNQADRELFHQLRTRADAVMAGAGTVRAEHYGRLVRDPALREQRARDGLAPDPLAVVVSGRLDLPAAAVPLLRDADSTVVVLTASPGELPAAAARVEYVRAGTAAVDLRAALRELRTRFGIRSILCEGGPTLNAALLADGLVDELFLSVAPKLVGGPAPLTIVEGGPDLAPADMELVSLLESEGHLFARYRLAPPER